MFLLASCTMLRMHTQTHTELSGQWRYSVLGDKQWPEQQVLGYRHAEEFRVCQDVEIMKSAGCVHRLVYAAEMRVERCQGRGCSCGETGLCCMQPLGHTPFTAVVAIVAVILGWPTSAK
jgi:hypothetical protein